MLGIENSLFKQTPLPYRVILFQKFLYQNMRLPGEILKWQLQENVPGEFPFTAGLFPFKREGEDPTRMFAGEGGPERTNKRFHLCKFSGCLQKDFLLLSIRLLYMEMIQELDQIFLVKSVMLEFPYVVWTICKKLYTLGLIFASTH